MSESNGTPRTFFRIRDWHSRFENNRSREVKELEWVKMPIEIGSEEYAELMEDGQGAAVLGVWTVLVWMAARCRPRGSLIKFDGAPHTIESIAKRAGIAAPLCRHACGVLAALGWLEQPAFTRHALIDGRKVPTPPQERRTEVPMSPQEGAASRRARGLDQSRENNTPPGSPQGGTPPANGNGHRPPRRRPSRSEEVAAYLYKKHQRQQEEHSHEPNRENPESDSSRAVDRVG